MHFPDPPVSFAQSASVCLVVAWILPLQLQYKADLAWMKGVSWLTEGSLNLEQAKKVGQLVSEVT